MNEHKKVSLKHIGPGGLRCPCCTPYNKGKKNKKFVNRLYRRNSKISNMD